MPHPARNPVTGPPVGPPLPPEALPTHLVLHSQAKVADLDQVALGGCERRKGMRRDATGVEQEGRDAMSGGPDTDPMTGRAALVLDGRLCL
jgi:hypothetical protein